MDYPLYNWLIEPCGLRESDADQLAKQLCDDYKILSIESLSNVLRVQPNFLFDIKCPLAYTLQISSHLYLKSTKSLETVTSKELHTACSNLGFSSEILDALQRRNISGYVLSCLPLENVFDSGSETLQASNQSSDIKNLQSFVERWKQEGIPVHLFCGIERHSFSGEQPKKRKATEEISNNSHGDVTLSSVSNSNDTHNEANTAVAAETKNDGTVLSKQDYATMAPTAAPAESAATSNVPAVKLSSTQQVEREASSASEMEAPPAPPSLQAILKDTSGGASGGVPSSASGRSPAATVGKVSQSAAVEQHINAILKHKELMLSTVESEQIKGAKYFVSLNSNTHFKGHFKLILEHQCLVCLCNILRQSSHEMLSLHAIAAINNIFAMDKDSNTVANLLTEKEHMCPTLLKKLDEAHHFDFYEAVLWCLQTLVSESAVRDELLSLNIVPQTVKIFEKTQESDSSLRAQILNLTCNLLQTQPIPPLEEVKPLLVIAQCSIDGAKCVHAALTALYFFTKHPAESAQREAYLLEIFQSEHLLRTIVEQAGNISQAKVNQVARKVIENLTTTKVKENADKLVALNIADTLKAQLLSPKHPVLVSAVCCITNLGATSTTSVASFLAAGLYGAVCRTYARAARKDLVKEAIYAMKHAIVGATTDKQVEGLIDAGLLMVVCDAMLDLTLVGCVEIALTTLFLVLHKCPTAAVYDEVIRLVYELDGWKAVDRCRKSEDVRVREKAERMNIVAIRAQHWNHKEVK